MIVLYFECDVCGDEAQNDILEFEALKFQVLPKGWLYADGKVYCPDCKRTSGVVVG